MAPWYRGFKGSIEPADSGTYKVSGVWKKLDKYSIEITELPLKKWTRDFKSFVEELMQQGEVTDMKEFHKDNTVDFQIKLRDEVNSLDIEKKLKLSSSINCNNLVLFDKNNQIRKYKDELQILEEFFNLRLDFYAKRKNHQLKLLTKDMRILENKSRFI